MDDIKEIKLDVKELLQRSAVHNQILMEHKNFSVALQNEQKVIKTQIEPLIKDHYILTVILKGLGIIATGFLIQYLIKKLLG